MNPQAYIEMSQTEDVHWWFVARREILTDCLLQLNLPTQANVLEVGCGTGGNLNMLEQFGLVHGIEMDPQALNLANQKSSHRHLLTQGKCPDDLDFGDKTFDLICLFDVLEHIEHDTQTLAFLKKRLSPNGKIIITVPAHPWMFGPHDQHLHHHRRYTKSQLGQVLAQAGLAPVRLSYFNCLLFPLAALTRIFEKIFHNKQATGTNIPAQPLNAFFKTIFASERALLRHSNLPFGVSFLCIAKA